MFTPIENGELLTPEPGGRGSVLLAGGTIAKVGAVDRRALDRLGVDYDVIDATDRLVAPGLIDVHEHLLGGSGESGFATQTPEIRLAEIVTAGITCVVGCLGVDTTMKTMPGLLARAKALREQGVTAHVWTGGYNVPPTTILAGVREDVMFIAEVVGAGEIAIADERSTDPDAHELARLVNDAYVGGLLSGKAGVTHFHVGERPQRLRLLRQIIDDFETSPAWLYPTHVERDEALFGEAVDLANRGATVDVDVVEKDLPKWLRRYREAGGPPERLTASSDASVTGPGNLFAQVRACVLEHGFAPPEALALVTANPARVLKLRAKGRLEAGRDADVVVLDRASWEVREVVAGGRRLVRDGRMAVRERWEDGNERGTLTGRGLR